MAKKDSDLFDRLRQAGLRKQAAKALSEVSEGAGKKAQQAARAAANELRALADEIERRLPAATPASQASGDKSSATRRARTTAPRSTKSPAGRTPRTATAKPKPQPRRSTARASAGSRSTTPSASTASATDSDAPKPEPAA